MGEEVYLGLINYNENTCGNAEGVQSGVCANKLLWWSRNALMTTAESSMMHGKVDVSSSGCLIMNKNGEIKSGDCKSDKAFICQFSCQLAATNSKLSLFNLETVFQALRLRSEVSQTNAPTAILSPMVGLRCKIAT